MACSSNEQLGISKILQLEFAGMAVVNGIIKTCVRRSQAGLSPLSLPWQGVAATSVAGYAINVTDQKLFVGLKKLSNECLLNRQNMDNETREKISTVAAAIGTCFLDLFCSVPMANLSSTYSAQPHSRLRDVNWFTYASIALVLAGNFCFIPLYYGTQNLLRNRSGFRGAGDTIFASVVACLLANITLNIFDTCRTMAVTGVGDGGDNRSFPLRVLESYGMGMISYILVGIVRGLDLHRSLHQDSKEDGFDIEMPNIGNIELKCYASDQSAV